jgi:hypothetical protein
MVGGVRQGRGLGNLKKKGSTQAQSRLPAKNACGIAAFGGKAHVPLVELKRRERLAIHQVGWARVEEG